MAAVAERVPVPAADARREHPSPWQLGGLSVRELSRRVWNEMNGDEVLDRAAGLSYYVIFALFPALLFLASLLGILPIPHLMGRLMRSVDQFLPPDAGSLIHKTMREVLNGSHGGLVSIGALVALWSASAGVASMMNALNVAYDVEEPRSWWRRRLLAISLTVALAVVVLIAAVLMVFGGPIGEFLGTVVGLGNVALMVWDVVQWPVAVFFVVLGIALVYYAAPAAKEKGERAPGEASTARPEAPTVQAGAHRDPREQRLAGARALTIADADAAAERAVAVVSRTATGVKTGVRALPSVATWSVMRVAAKALGAFGRPRTLPAGVERERQRRVA